MKAPVLDVVVPVFNEEVTLDASVRRLHAHLVATFPYPFRITVADNASTDATLEVAGRLAGELDGVAVVHLEQKGRGRALKRVWLASDASVLAYMDVDLSTDLDALWPLVAPLMSGHSDVAIGTRLHRDSRVVRGAKREAISRGYNLMLRTALGASFSDAQCGFKAIRADVAHELLPLVEDPTWFFDTELLVLAQRSGLRIHEVPVDWFDDPDSRVDIVRTAKDDLRGIRRMKRSFARGFLPTEDIRSRMGRTSPASGVGAHAVRFGIVGAATTVLHLALFALLTSGAIGGGVGSQTANVVALLLSTIVNTAANRRWTFGIRGPGSALRHHLQALGVFAVTWGLTAAALAGLHAFWGDAPTAVETVVVGVANVVSTVVKFAAMRAWIFAERSVAASPASEIAARDATSGRLPAGR
ncbi:glycosyltransferase [Janibacter sp. G1551]|uniref:glycosyltransferase n=1 Tax=Janibacter sp. G1551 TaxID=3420440 RepID=UPI003D03B001